MVREGWVTFAAPAPILLYPIKYLQVRLRFRVRNRIRFNLKDRVRVRVSIHVRVRVCLD